MIAAAGFVGSHTHGRSVRSRGRSFIQFCFVFLIMTASASSARGGPVDEIPVGDPLESELRILDLEGPAYRPGLRLRRLHTRPLQALELAGPAGSDTVRSAASTIARARLWRALLRDLPDTLGLPVAGATPRLWSRTGPHQERFEISGGLEGRGDVQRGEASHFASGSGLRTRIGGGTGHWSVFTDLLIGRVDQARSFADPLVPGNDLVTHVVAASLAYTDDAGNWAVRLGRGQFHWGPGFEGSLLLSKTAPPITALSMRARIEFLRADAIAINGTLASAGGEQLAAHRIEWQPLDGLRIGLAEAARYRSEAWQPLYLVGVIPYVLVQRLQVQDEPDSAVALRNNVQIAGDMAWRIVPGLRVYGEVLIDDLHAKTADNPNKLAFQVGLEGVTDLMGGRATGGVEATRVSRYVYTSFFGRAFETHSEPLGWPDGPDALRIALRMGWDPNDAWQLGLRAADQKLGNSGLEDPFIPGSPDVDVWKFTPPSERTRELEGTVRWWPRSGVDLMLGAGRRWIDDAGHVEGVNRRETFGFLALRLVR
jgi:hypothetical protein